MNTCDDDAAKILMEIPSHTWELKKKLNLSFELSYKFEDSKLTKNESSTQN